MNPVRALAVIAVFTSLYAGLSAFIAWGLLVWMPRWFVPDYPTIAGDTTTPDEDFRQFMADHGAHEPVYDWAADPEAFR